MGPAANLKIGIIENDLLIAESIVVTLQSIGYRTTQPVRNYTDALQMIKTEAPDLLLVDIMLDGEKDGIDLAATVNKDYGIPFIFLTANSDHATVIRAKEVKPYSYLVKPFNGNDLYTAIEIAFSNFNNQRNTEKQTVSTSPIKDVVFIKEGELYHKVDINDILYIQSDNIYLTIYTFKRHFAIRAKLDDFISGYLKENFFRVHRSYAINVKHLETINDITVKVAGREVPMHKNYKQELLQVIKAIK